MKKTIITLIKVSVWVGFLFLTGCPQFIFSTMGKDEVILKNKAIQYGIVGSSKEEVDEMMEINRTLNSFCNEKITYAEAKMKQGKYYDSFDYFRDLRDIKNKCNELVGMEDYYIADYSIQTLNMYHMEAVRMGKIGPDDIPKARAKYFSEEVLKEEDARKNSKPINWLLILNWLLLFYLKSMPVAFILFLTWLYQGSEYKRLQVRSPVSFIISLILYPFVIGASIRRWWIDQGRSFGAEVEIRRTREKFFTMLSTDEIKLVKDFARSKLSIKEFRGDLEEKGYKIRYSLLPIILITILFQFVPRADALAEDACVDNVKIVMNHDHYGGDNFSLNHDFEKVFSNLIGIMPDDTNPLIVLESNLYNHIVLFICCIKSGYWRGIDHVPLCVVECLIQNKFYLTTNTNEKNKKYYSWIINPSSISGLRSIEKHSFVPG